MINLHWGLFYDIYNRINKHNKRPAHYLAVMFLTQFDT